MDLFDLAIASKLSGGGGGGGGDDTLTKLIDRTITSLVIPDDVERIGVSAFASCAELETVVLHENVKSIANYAFQNCTKLMSITSRATDPPSLLGSGSLSSVPANCNIYVPADSVDAYKAANRWSARASYIQAIP